MKNTKKIGFTLTELTVVLVIIAIIAAIAVPSFIKYWRIAEFQKNESNAKTIYLAAESKLTYYRSSGQWEKFQERLKREGTQAVFADSTSELNGRIYTVTLDANTYQEKAGRDDLLLQLIDDYSYDKQVMNGAIAIEIDSETGEVYSAFFATKCKGLSYAERDADDYLTMRDRDYESRKKRLLGYYSTEDTANVVHLKPIRLRITTISLQNSEKLSLNWSSNVGNSLDVSYELTFYKNSDKSKQFTMTVSPYEMRKNGWTATSGTTEGLVSFEIQDKKGNSKGQWTFPITYSDNRYSLILDAMMSAKVQAVLASGSGTTAEALARTSSTSICRLGKVASDLKNPQDIYATVKAVSYAGKKDEPSTQEYRNSEAVSSNVANSMYADGTKDGNVKIAAFRHLSNIRYYDESNTAEFALTSRNLDWSSVGTGLYDFELEKTLDEKVLVKKLLPALEKKQKKSIEVDVSNTDRTFGTIFGSEITRRYPEGLEEDSYVVKCNGAGGQSFGAFIPGGLTLELVGDSNDYFGKGLSGGKLIVYPPKGVKYKHDENIIIGNVALYGATSGKAFINGVAGERFAVRNSGATAVVEGVGDHGCEYMTGGCVAVLGKTGKNFAAGMSGGIAYVLDMENDLYMKVNKQLVNLERVTSKYDVSCLKNMICEHVSYTNSEIGKEILDNFTDYLPKFKKIIPADYERMMTAILQMEEQGMSSEQAKIEAFYMVKGGR